MAEGIQWRGDRVYVVLREPDPARPGKKKVVWHAGATHGFHDEESAVAWRDQRRVAVRARKSVARDRMTVRDYLDTWLPAHVAVKDLKPSTAESYEEKLKHVDGYPFAQMQIQLVRPADVKGLYAAMLKDGKSKRTVEYVGTLLRMAFKAAVAEYGLITESPAASIAIPRPRAAPATTWKKEQARVLLESLAKDRYGRMFAVQGATGTRRGELLALRWDDVDLEDGWILFSKNRVRLARGFSEGTLKNDRPKQVSLDEGTVALLRKHRKEQTKDRMKAGAKWFDGGYVFCNAHGGPLNPSNLARYWKQAVQDAGVPYLKPHTLRHMHATLLLEAGVPAHVVSERLGHKDVTTTLKVYGHVTARQQRQAATVFADWIAE